MKRHLLRAVASAAALVTLAVPGSASAQTTASGFAVNHFDSAERGSEWFVMDSLDLRGHLRPAVGAVFEQAYRPLVLTDTQGNIARSIVRDQSFLHLGASLVLWDRLRVAADVPIMTYADGHTGVGDGTVYPAPVHSAGIGDVRLGADARLVGRHGDPFTAAVGVQVSLPTGAQDSYAGDGSTRITPHLLAAGDVGVFTYAAKAGVVVRTYGEDYDHGQVGTELDIGGAVGLRLADRKLVVGPEVFAKSVFTDGAFFSKKATPVEGLIGAHYTFLECLRGGAGVSTGFTEGYGTPVFRGIVSLEWTPGFHEDEPPPAPPPPPPVEPPPPPPPAPVAAPVVVAPPADPDRDHDSIPNDTDACPDEPGKPDPDPKRNGCPKAFVKDGKIQILDQVKFKTGSAEISGADSAEVLQAVKSVLDGHGEITAVEVEGHTDNRGNAANNKKLSAARAAAVVRWLTSHGIEASRLTSAGYGQERPIDSNDTEEGRKNNGRVEFHIAR